MTGRAWIPAYAGMTKREAGIDNIDAPRIGASNIFHFIFFIFNLAGGLHFDDDGDDQRSALSLFI